MQFEYVEESGKKYLVYNKTIDTELDMVTIGMLENNDISGLLPFYYLQKDNDISLRYDYSGFEQIEKVYGRRINKKRLLALLKSIIAVVESCEEYMIDKEQIVLDPNYVFSDENGQIIKYIVFPIRNNAENFYDNLRESIFRFAFDQDDNSSYVEKLSDFFRNDTTFSLDRFREMVTSIEKAGGKEIQYRFIDPTKDGPNRSGIQNDDDREDNGQNWKSVSYDEPEEDDEEEVVESKIKGLFGFLKKDKSSSKPQKKKVEKKEKKNKNSSFGGIAIPGLEEKTHVEENQESQANIVIPNQDSSVKSQKLNMDYHHVEKEDFGHTELITKEESEAEDSGSYEKALYSITRASTNERFQIVNSVTKLGRKESITDICITDNTHVGRLHAILYVEEDGLYVVDNGSKNGTFVNDRSERISDKTKLHSGDKLFLGDEELMID